MKFGKVLLVTVLSAATLVGCAVGAGYYYKDKLVEFAKTQADSYIDEKLENAHGADGSNGKSAYEVAVDNGFEGTEAEWVASLSEARAMYLHTISLKSGINGVKAYMNVFTPSPEPFTVESLGSYLYNKSFSDYYYTYPVTGAITAINDEAYQEALDAGLDNIAEVVSATSFPIVGAWGADSGATVRLAYLIGSGNVFLTVNSNYTLVDCVVEVS